MSTTMRMLSRLLLMFSKKSLASLMPFRQAICLFMSRVYGDKATGAELADKLKGDPKAALQSLADRPEWWAHLYVAETMKKQPQLRDTAILKKLEKDDNPLVKEEVAEMSSGK